MTEVASECGKDILGTNCISYMEFPILIKLIDAKKPLSIQVHPDDSYALKHEGQYGKTEMWYVLDAKEGAYIYQGFEREITGEEFDEIQQSSNVTYRVYDYGRLGTDGKPRQLHIQQSIDVTKLSRPEQYESPNEHMVSCDFFNVDHFAVDENMIFEDVADSSSFVSLIITDGCVLITNGQKKMIAKKGESVFIPAGSGKFSVSGNGEFLVTTVPKKEAGALKETA